jgi:hypothetical protein
LFFIYLLANQDTKDPEGAARKAVSRLIDYVSPYINPVITAADDFEESIRLDPRIAAATDLIIEFNDKIEKSLDNVMKNDQIQYYFERYFVLFSCSKSYSFACIFS